MKSLIRLVVLIVFLGFVINPAKAAFTSLYVFGDGISCTATNPQAGPFYYGKRFSNGRVWVEVLAQQQGLQFNPASNTNAYFGNTSADLVNEVNKFNISPDSAKNALVVIWVNNADLYYPALADTPTLDGFTPCINQGQINHAAAIASLYAKGIRTLVMPNVVDVSTIPAFNTSRYASTFHQAAVNYNNAFYQMLDQARAKYPDLTIIVPDFYSLLNDLLANPDQYGVKNVLVNGQPMDAVDAYNYNFPLASINGYGTNYIFWDQKNPTALVHTIMANFAQQLISPVQIGKLTTYDGSNRLDLVNLPIGVTGCVDESTNLTQGSWSLLTNFTSASATQSLFVTAPPLPLGTNVYTGGGGSVNLDPNDTNNVSTNPPVPLNSAAKFYRLRFPLNWNWP
jgi:phospholipase/lecithinase/hemolysin